jgi:Holliday junction resolvase RusA-like endonuclease
VNPLAFTVHGSPAPAGSKKAVPIGKRWGVVDANPKAKGWKVQVAQHAGIAMQGRELYRGPLKLTLRFYVRRPKSHYAASGLVRPAAPEHPTSKPDVLKLARGVEDALTGVVYGDDAQIVTEFLAKRYGPERVEIVVEPYS